MLQYHMIADGRVQGVGFRYFVQMEADRHKIAGWVKTVMTAGWKSLPKALKSR